jgi:hypothetical protein
LGRDFGFARVNEACADNAAMESFFALQKNVLDRQRWATRQDLRLAIIAWIERVEGSEQWLTGDEPYRRWSGAEVLKAMQYGGVLDGHAYPQVRRRGRRRRWRVRSAPASHSLHPGRCRSADKPGPVHEPVATAEGITADEPPAPTTRSDPHPISRAGARAPQRHRNDRHPARHLPQATPRTTPAARRRLELTRFGGQGR